MSVNPQLASALQSLTAALSSMSGSSSDASSEAPTGFEGVSAPVVDNGLNTKIYLRSEAQEVPAELVGTITYEQLVDRYFDISGDYTVTITVNETSSPIDPSETYGPGVSTIIVTEQTAALG